jgi:hypothetical protein
VSKRPTRSPPATPDDLVLPPIGIRELTAGEDAWRAAVKVLAANGMTVDTRLLIGPTSIEHTIKPTPDSAHLRMVVAQFEEAAGTAVQPFLALMIALRPATVLSIMLWPDTSFVNWLDPSATGSTDYLQGGHRSAIKDLLAMVPVAQQVQRLRVEREALEAALVAGAGAPTAWRVRLGNRKGESEWVIVEKTPEAAVRRHLDLEHAIDGFRNVTFHRRTLKYVALAGGPLARLARNLERDGIDNAKPLPEMSLTDIDRFIARRVR